MGRQLVVVGRRLGWPWLVGEVGARQGAGSPLVGEGVPQSHWDGGEVEVQSDVDSDRDGGRGRGRRRVASGGSSGVSVHTVVGVVAEAVGAQFVNIAGDAAAELARLGKRATRDDAGRVLLGSGSAGGGFPQGSGGRVLDLLVGAWRTPAVVVSFDVA